MSARHPMGDSVSNPQPLRSLDEIRADILALERATEGLLSEIVGVKEGA